MSGARISDMTLRGSLPSSGALVPVVIDGDTTNYSYDLGPSIASGVQGAATRTALSQVSGATAGMVRQLTESGREGAFVFDFANHATDVTNDPQQGVYVAPSSDTTGASGAWVRKFDGLHNIKWFGAKGDTVFDASNNIVSGTDDSAAIQAALTYLGTLLSGSSPGGGGLFFPIGIYKTSTYCTVPKNVRITGSGMHSSIIASDVGTIAGATNGETLRNGSVFYSNWPSNTTTDSRVRIDNLGFICSNGDNYGAAFYDNGGSNNTFTHCHVKGFKCGVVFDQSEICHVDYCEFGSQITASVWLVNGATLTPGNNGDFTNLITVSHCQINNGATCYGILDDGGTTRHYLDNNFNGCSNHIRVAGATVCEIQGGEYEASTDDSIYLTHLASDGRGVGGSVVYIDGAFISMGHTSSSCVNSGGSTTKLAVTNTYLASGAAATPISGVGNITELDIGQGVTTNSTTYELISTQNGPALLTDVRIQWPIKSYTGTALAIATKQYVQALIQATNPAGCTITIPSDTTTHLPTGTVILFEQTTADGTVIYAPDAGVTLTGPLQTNAQYQRILARKIASDSWRVTLEGAPTSYVVKSAIRVSHTGDTNETTLATITIPADVLGVNGRIEIDAHFSGVNVAGTAKTSCVRFGGLLLDSGGPTTSNLDQRYNTAIANRNATNSQLIDSTRVAGAGLSFTTKTIAVDTTGDQTITLTGQLATATDTIALEGYIVKVFPR